MNAFIQVTTTTETEEQALAIARHLVAAKLAACVQVTGPIESTYLWKGKMEDAREYLCLIKTRSGLFDEVKAAIKEMHSYETPEIIAIPIVKGDSDYLKWIGDTLADHS